jgi:plastocyanin
VRGKELSRRAVLMMDTFDSRALRRTDCYGQRFMKAGTFPYHILPMHGDCVTNARPFTVKVVERKSDTTMTQKSVVVRSQNGKFRAEPAEVTIEVGDLVLWNCPDGRGVPYVVIGDKEFFSSQRMVNESGYSHAFGSAGEYHWVDAHGSGATGVVRVKDLACNQPGDFEQWRNLLGKGTLVTISDTEVEPREVDIVTGQTVFFAVTKGPGISITDRRLAGQAAVKGEELAKKRRK